MNNNIIIQTIQIYTSVEKTDSKVNSKIVETALFTKQQMMNVLCEVSTFDGFILNLVQRKYS